MANNRDKGKRGERKGRALLERVIPDLRRNANEQSQRGGTDLISDKYPELDIEVKHGQSYTWKGVHKVLDQLLGEGKEGNLKIALILPHRNTNYAILDIPTLIKLLEAHKKVRG